MMTLAAALQGVTNYGGTVTISSERTLENLTTINTAVSGTVVVEHLDSPQWICNSNFSSSFRS